MKKLYAFSLFALIALSTIPAAAQSEKRFEVFGSVNRMGFAAQGTKLPPGLGFGGGAAYQLSKHFTGTMRFVHESSRTATLISDLGNTQLHISRNYFGGGMRYCILNCDGRVRPFGYGEMGYGRNTISVNGQDLFGYARRTATMMGSFGGGVDFSIPKTKKWSIELMYGLAFGGKQVNYYSGQQYGIGARTNGATLSVLYCLTCK